VRGKLFVRERLLHRLMRKMRITLRLINLLSTKKQYFTRVEKHLKKSRTKLRRIINDKHCKVDTPLTTESCSPSILVLGNNRFTRMNDGEVALFSLKKGRDIIITGLAHRLTLTRKDKLERSLIGNLREFSGAF